MLPRITVNGAQFLRPMICQHLMKVPVYQQSRSMICWCHAMGRSLLLPVPVSLIAPIREEAGIIFVDGIMPQRCAVWWIARPRNGKKQIGISWVDFYQKIM